MACEKARRAKSEFNQKGYSGVITHHVSMPCGARSPLLKTTKYKNEVTCKTCARYLKVETR